MKSRSSKCDMQRPRQFIICSLFYVHLRSSIQNRDRLQAYTGTVSFTCSPSVGNGIIPRRHRLRALLRQFFNTKNSIRCPFSRNSQCKLAETANSAIRHADSLQNRLYLRITPFITFRSVYVPSKQPDVSCSVLFPQTAYLQHWNNIQPFPFPMQGSAMQL